MNMHDAATAKTRTDQTFEATATEKKPLKRFYHKPEEVDFIKIAHQFYSQTLWSGLTIMGPSNSAEPTVYSERRS